MDKIVEKCTLCNKKALGTVSVICSSSVIKYYGLCKIHKLHHLSRTHGGDWPLDVALEFDSDLHRWKMEYELNKRRG